MASDPKFYTKGALLLVAAVGAFVGMSSLLRPQLIMVPVYTEPNQLRNMQFTVLFFVAVAVEIVAVVQFGNLNNQKRVLEYLCAPLFALAVQFGTLGDSQLKAVSPEVREIAVRASVACILLIAMSLIAVHVLSPRDTSDKSSKDNGNPATRFGLVLAFMVAFLQGSFVILLPEYADPISMTFGRSSTVGLRTIGIALISVGAVELATFAEGDTKTQKRVLMYLGLGLTIQSYMFVQEIIYPSLGSDVQQMMIPFIGFNTFAQVIIAYIAFVYKATNKATKKKD
jgi:hypothetical protein